MEPNYSTCLAVSIFWMTGIQNAAVLPDPVLARANISFPSSASGIAFSWICVGSDQPSWEIALNEFKEYYKLYCTEWEIIYTKSFQKSKT